MQAHQHTVAALQLQMMTALSAPLPGQACTMHVLSCFWGVQYDDAFPRRDLVGVHPQKQEGLFWGCCCVPAGRLHAEDFYDFARVADE